MNPRDLFTRSVTCTAEGCDEDFEVGFRIIPGEPRVLYYPDGSGYPGTPDTVEITDPDDDEWTPPCGHPQDWEALCQHIEDNLDPWSFDD